MRTHQLKVDQLSTDGYRWYLGYLSALDAKDVRAYGAFLAGGCVMQFNNAPQVRGKDKALQDLAHYWQSIEDELVAEFRRYTDTRPLFAPTR